MVGPPTTLGTAKSGGWLRLEFRYSEALDVAEQAAGIKSTFFPWRETAIPT